MNVLEIATSRLRAGLCVLPALVAEKRPALSTWKEYQTRRPTEDELGSWFTNGQGMCIVAGLPVRTTLHNDSLFWKWG